MVKKKQPKGKKTPAQLKKEAEKRLKEREKKKKREAEKKQKKKEREALKALKLPKFLTKKKKQLTKQQKEEEEKRQEFLEKLPEIKNIKLLAFIEKFIDERPRARKYFGVLRYLTKRQIKQFVKNYFRQNKLHSQEYLKELEKEVELHPSKFDLLLPRDPAKRKRRIKHFVKLISEPPILDSREYLERYIEMHPEIAKQYLSVMEAEEEKKKEEEEEIPKPRRKRAKRKVPAKRPRRMERITPEEAIKIMGKKPTARPVKVPKRRVTRRPPRPKFVKLKKKPRTKEIDEIMSLEMTIDKTLETGARRYAKGLLADTINTSNEKFGNEEVKLTKSSPYIIQLESYLFQNSTTFRSYFRNIGSITVFLTNLSTYTLTFRNRLNNYFYTAQHLATLTHIQKFPEVFKDTRVSESDRHFVNERIDRDTSQVVITAGNYLYQVRYPGARRLTRPLPTEMSLPFKLPPNRLTQCENFKDIKEYESHPWDIILYTDEGITYCFVIGNLLQQFEEEDYNNPKTGNRFSQDFIDEISKYSLQRVVFGEPEEEEPEMELEKEEVRKIKEIAPGLLDAILADIQRLEGGLSKFGSHDEEICNYCEKHVNADETHKSVVYKGKGNSEIVNFCTVKCFEDWERPRK